jgi:sec-independent protein translocase protein TatA
MGGLGFGELLIILIIVMLVFGVGKLPQLGDALGKSIRNFKKAATTSDEIDVTPRPNGLPAGSEANKAPAAPDEARKA